MSVEVVVPWRAGCPHREKAWERCRGRYEWPVVEAAGGVPWVKALAVHPAVERSAAEVIVMADADVWCDGIDRAIRAVICGVAEWAIPHLLVHRLTQDGDLEQRPYRGIPGGGIVVARRDTLLDVPLDPRFVGWGQEDESWGAALTVIAGPPWRGAADLTHYWHPPQPRHSRTRGSREGWNLRRRYLRACANPDDMRTLIGEAKDALAAAQPDLHDHTPSLDR